MRSQKTTTLWRKKLVAPPDPPAAARHWTPHEPPTAGGRELRLEARPPARFNSLRSQETVNQKQRPLGNTLLAQRYTLSGNSYFWRTARRRFGWTTDFRDALRGFDHGFHGFRGLRSLAEKFHGKKRSNTGIPSGLGASHSPLTAKSAACTTTPRRPSLLPLPAWAGRGRRLGLIFAA